MNNETTKETPQVEAAAAETERRKKVKVNMDIPASCERMKNLLDEARRVASSADWTHLSTAVAELRALLRPKPGTLAWEQEIGYYLGHDPHLRWDAAPTPTPTQLPGVDGVEIETPSGEGGGKPWSPCDIASIPEIGLEFKSVHTKTYHKYFCYWHSAGTSDEHVYEITVCQFEGHWRSTLLNDGNTVCELLSRSKHNAIRLGLAAMRQYLIKGHHSAWRTYRKTRAGARPSLPANQPIN